MTYYLIADGTQFAPRVSKDAVLYAYSPEICRYDYSVHWTSGHTVYDQCRSVAFLYRSKPLISLVPFNLLFHCFQG